MINITIIAWVLLGFWLSMIALLFVVLYTKLKKSVPLRRRRSFKLIKGENVE